MPARVLIADDEPSIRFVLRETLESAGHDVSDVSNGDDALRLLTEASFDLAFFDIRMPGASGLDLLERARTVGSDVAIVIITAQNTFENAVEAMKRGALDYLVKPFAMAEVQALVTKTLRVRALEKEVSALRREMGARIVAGTDSPIFPYGLALVVRPRLTPCLRCVLEEQPAPGSGPLQLMPSVPVWSAHEFRKPICWP